MVIYEHFFIKAHLPSPFLYIVVNTDNNFSSVKFWKQEFEHHVIPMVAGPTGLLIL